MTLRRRLPWLPALAFALLCPQVVLGENEPPPPSSSAASALVETPPPKAITDAIAKAAETARDVLVVFDASDLGGWCERMRKEILSHPKFIKGVEAGFVTVILDHSRKIPGEEETRRRLLAYERRLDVGRFPSVLLLDSAGRAYARTGYIGDNPDVFLKHLAELRAIRERRDALIAKARRNSGYIRAEHLANALRTIDGSLVAEYAPLFEELRAADSADKHGVILDYDINRLFGDARETARSARNPGAARRMFDDFLAARPQMPALRRQRVLLERFRYLDKTGADGLSRLERSLKKISELREMLALAPKSPEAARINKLIEDESLEIQSMSDETSDPVRLRR